MNVPPSRAKEISGGLKNALDRGESLAKAKQSFINAGYTSQEVQAATQMVRSSPIQNVNPLPASEIQANSTNTSSSKKTIIIISIIGVIILAGALVLGLFWNKLF